MQTKLQAIALYTHIRREIVRTFRLASQVFLPPVITTALYFFIFGNLIGNRIGTIEDVSYSMFIAPGLIMMTVITNSYANVSTSMFSVRFQKSIEEVLVSPMHESSLLLGYVLGGVFRGVTVAFLVFVVSCFFVKLEIHNITLTCVVIVLVASIFSLAGFTNGMLARDFDDVMIVPTFILAPLTYLGGVFYSTSMLPPFWQTISDLNPVLYMVSALRDGMIGHQEGNILISMSIICILLIGLIFLNLYLLKKGTGLRK